MNDFVCLVGADKGWILEKMAGELASRLNYITIEDEPVSNALITYHMHYSYWNRRTSPIEGAYFTHIEESGNARRNFFRVAHSVDFCVTHADRYAQALREDGCQNVTTISPGIDTSLLRPRLQIGVVGRTYPSGRKGESLVRQMMDIPWIDWHFTGDGWPGPALHLKDEELPSFYSSMDYILVPSLYEGGPMCVAEALACGTEVIAPPVGWVPQFEHIEFRTGDADDLRRVLESVYQKKLDRASKVAGYTWDAYAEKYDRLFHGLAAKQGKTLAPVSRKADIPRINVVFGLHSDEANAKGGPSVRVPILASRVRQVSNINGIVWNRGEALHPETRLAHVLNLHPTESVKACIDTLKARDIPTILSPIFLDFSERAKMDRMNAAIQCAYDNAELEKILDRLATGPDDRPPEEAWRDFHSVFGDFGQVQYLLDNVDHLVFLSEHEQQLMLRYGFKLGASSIIRNPVDCARYLDGDPELFKKTYGLTDYVLCVGRLEKRKNQILLAHALRDLDIPLIFAGHGPDKAYADLIRGVAGANAHFIGPLEPSSQMLASAYAGARVYCLPSWAEGASLANLEAAASGCTMVVSDRSSEKEYFRDYATYCAPDNPNSIRGAVIKAFDNPLTHSQKREFREFIRENYSWENHVDQTLKLYGSVLRNSHGARASSNLKVTDRPVYIDISAFIQQPLDLVGPTRLEYEIASLLLHSLPGQAQLVRWEAEKENFVSIPAEYIAAFDGSAQRPKSWLEGETGLRSGAVLVMSAATWCVNPQEAMSRMAYVNERNVALACAVIDADDRVYGCPFPKGKSESLKWFRRIIGDAPAILVNTHALGREIEKSLSKKFLPCRRILKLPLTNALHQAGTNLWPDLQRIISLVGKGRFVLCVGEDNGKTNYALLIRIWRYLVRELSEKATPPLVIAITNSEDKSFGDRCLAHYTEVVDKVRFVYRPDLATLEWLYQNCIFLAYPAYYESWGFPLADAIANVKSAIVSATGPLSEIAGDTLECLAPDDFAAWKDSIIRHIRMLGVVDSEGRMLEARQQELQTSIADPEFISTLLSLRCTPEYKSLSRQPMGEFNKADRWRYFGRGWRIIAGKGIWENGQPCSLLFRYRRGKLPSALTLELKADVPVEITVKINDVAQIIRVTPGLGNHRILLPEMEETSPVSNLSAILSLRPVEATNGNSGEREIPRIVLVSMNVRECSAEEAKALSLLEPLRARMPASSVKIQALLLKRSDLSSLMANSGIVSLFLWILKFGRMEEPIVESCRDDIISIFKDLHKTDSGYGDKRYTALVHAIWRSRADLHQYSPQNEGHRQLIVDWFYKQTSQEYGLNGWE